eukprot:TRINITY_DN29643_c0_g1_i1.p1 TRINITY_DN29643_c0_g1~~TRINITY_DN29643_c0_g1_i1.p1  ORF type:complete len:181 (-),score=3.20 TRINITY_DN29643_c0_g1_i1:2-544(-)
MVDTHRPVLSQHERQGTRSGYSQLRDAVAVTSIVTRHEQASTSGFPQFERNHLSTAGRSHTAPRTGCLDIGAHCAAALKPRPMPARRLSERSGRSTLESASGPGARMVEWARTECANAVHIKRHRGNVAMLRPADWGLSLIHISEPTRLLSISDAVFCLKKKKQNARQMEKVDQKKDINA